ncbi:exodeoxyribonuclease I [Paraferrimonas sedimenticola]|uniref:Exodeoxyribonuclease I n=1 Tax=Paraferrimonas sedimenticola TaxID=375674 RepID=A0AA37RWA4_9GAMM|nr:exodeoxyribonuclease I [Paraferrimonas sedimenticola]GLP96484.1 exodeoxyribonuclease I [Paraferrimonas sedimenticola]
MNQATLLWHDYETWGVHPGKDRPAQFAGIRTDLDLNPIGEPIELFCQLATDYLPQPEAMLVTGITPQHANANGLVEAEFIAKVNQHMRQANTCTVGYNSIRFDDEVTRYTLYRNFFDPYEREWKDNNSRWDLIDLVRACYALRPEGIEWPTDAEGKPTFRLEKLTEANGIGHANAHDAVSDVYATIAMAKAIKQAQPKLYDYGFKLRRKQAVEQQLDVSKLTPLVHINSRYGGWQGCCSLVAPVLRHPTNRNGVVMVNLTQDIQPLLDLTPEQLVEHLYTRNSDIKVPVSQLAVNQSPFVAPASTLQDESAERLGIDKQFARQQYRTLIQHQGIIREKLAQMFEQPREFEPQQDTDLMLYSGGFFSEADKAKMAIIRDTHPSNLAALSLKFDDARLDTMLFLYRARNYPYALSESELSRYRQHCQSRLNDPDYMVRLQDLFEQHQNHPKNLGLLSQLKLYLQSL